MGSTIIKYSFLFFVLSIAKFGNTQNVFNKAFDNVNLANYSTNALEWNQEFYLMQKIYTGFSNALEVVKMDSSGQVILKEIIIKDSNNSVRYGYAGSFQIINDMELCQLYRIHNDSALYLTYFDENINVNRTYRYGFNFDVYPAVINNTNDSTILILGLAYNTSTSNIVLINTDLYGNERWRTVFGETGKDDYGFSIGYVDNNNIIIGGQTLITSSISHPHLHKLTSSGVLVFDTIYTQYNSGGYFIYHPNFGRYLSAAKSISNKYYPVLLKLNSDFTINFSKEYFSNQTYVSVGHHSINDGGIITSSGMMIIDNIITGLFFQTNQYGDSVTSKLMDFIPGERAQFHDIRPTSDGGYIMAGETHIPSQDSWIVKVNSWGCDNVPCIVSVPEQPEKAVGELNCYPNPSNGNGIVKGSLKGVNSANSEIRVYNSIGQLVNTLPVTQENFEIEINLSVSGLYLVNLYRNNVLVGSKKWVIQ